MEYRDNARIDQSRVRYGGGGGRSPRGRGGQIAVGGGLGGIILVLIMMFLGGGNLGDILGGGAAAPQQAPQQQSGPQPECETGADIESNRECRWPAYQTAIQDYWSQAMEGYEYGTLQLFSGQIQTGCGTGSSEMGPFYCPADQTVYVDTTFTGELLDKLGAEGGDAAEAYIMAHEFGHHVSNLTGQMAEARAAGNQSGPDSPAVRLELQADCYAGVFFANTMKDPDSLIEQVTRDDLMRIADAARAVGDDHIQQQQQGRVVPESWTHGSSEMRQRWVAKGFDSGDPNVCDTFSTNDL